MPRISVIIPVYNVEKYLAECLDSVINQTEKDIEIICVEDCSTDSSLRILHEYAKKDDRIVILQNEVNSGLSVTRNNGLNIAQGEYVLFVDSDDLIEPTLIETTLKYAIDVDMVCFNYKEYNPQNIGNFSHSYLIEDGLYSNEDYFVESADKNSFVVVAVSKLYRREFLIQNNLQFEPDMLYEDNLFYLQCVLKANKIYSVNEQLYIYRIRQDSIMTKKLQPKNVNDYFKLIFTTTLEYIENDVSEKFSIAIEHFIAAIINTYINMNKQYIYDNANFDGTVCNKLQRVFSSKIIGLDNRIKFSTNQIETLNNKGKVLVYGAGDIARKTINYLDLLDVSITGVAVSDAKNNRKSLMGHTVKLLSDYERIKDDCVVIIAVSSKFSNEIEDCLREQGFKNYIKLF
ncbi:MAG: glycosyltransferase [Ruminococcaceae bacterium]|nr:glycosyltransferase [Oscillospiraceae bacterium]